MNATQEMRKSIPLLYISSFLRFSDAPSQKDVLSTVSCTQEALEGHSVGMKKQSSESPSKEASKEALAFLISPVWDLSSNPVLRM